MLYDNLPLPLPWYNGVTLQDRFRQNVAMNHVITQLAPSDGLLPFQFRKPVEGQLPGAWQIKCAEHRTLQEYIEGYDDLTVVDLTPFIPSALEWTTRVDPSGDSYDYLTFKNEKNALNMILPTLPDGLPPGVYYLQMEFYTRVGSALHINRWCSETFRVTNRPFSWMVPSDTCNYPCFKWSHNSDIPPMYYNGTDPTPFYNLLYLDTWITASEPEYVAEGKNDGYNEFHATMQKTVIKYRISTIIPDYIKVALYTMLLHENIYLFTEKALREGAIKNIDIQSSLSVDGALSTVEILFEQMSLMVKTNCTEEMDVPHPYTLGITPALSTEYCSGNGAVYVHITETFPVTLYGELWGKVGAGPYVLVVPYISRLDLLAGWNGTVDPVDAYTTFKVVLRTFTFDVCESDPSVPVPSC
jgi:hypothetical protein